MDARDPLLVGRRVAALLRQHWESQPAPGNKVLVVQGDPLTARGISAITRVVAEELGLPRCLITLDARIDPEHRPNADTLGVTIELTYSDVAKTLEDVELAALGSAIDAALTSKSRERERIEGRPLASYYSDYARLQEVSKAALRRACGSMTLAHTAAEISPFSVTSFYEVGLAQGGYARGDIVAYSEPSSDVDVAV